MDLLPLLHASNVRLLFDHCGRPTPDKGLDQPGFKALLEFGRSGRAAIKLSGFAKVSQEAYPYADTWPYIHALVDALHSITACGVRIGHSCAIRNELNMERC